MTTIAVYNLFLDSKYRSSGINSAPEFALQSPLYLSNPNHRFVATVKSADVPFSFKSLVAPYNTIRIRYVELPSIIAADFTITFPEGNYSITNILALLSSLIQSALTPFFSINPPQLNFTYDKNTGLVTLAMSPVVVGNATSLQFRWTDPNGDFMAQFFGFTGNADTFISYDAGGVPSNTNNVSEGHVICSPISSLYIRSSTLSQPTNNDEFLVEFRGSTSDILVKMPVLTPFNTWLSYNDGNTEVMLNNKLIDVIQLYITALTYDPLDLANVFWRIHLQIKEVRDTYLDDIEREQAKIDAEIRNLEMEKQRAIQELEGVSGELRSNLMSLQGETDEKEKTQEALKQELMQEIEQNRGLP